MDKETKVKVYHLTYCPFCKKAIELLRKNYQKLELIDVTQDEEKKESIKKRTSFLTFPQIFIGSKFIGGYDDLTRYLKIN